MNDSLVILFVVTVLGGLFWYLQKTGWLWVVYPKTPDISILEAFDSFLNNTKHRDQNTRRIISLVKDKFSEEQFLEMQEELVKIEVEANRQENPLITLRRAIMDAVDSDVREQALPELPEDERRKIYAELNKKGGNFSDANSIGLWLYSEVMCGVLRLYSSVKYDDAGEEDWFSYYVKCAESSAKTMAHMFRKRAAGEDHWFEATMFKLWDQNMEKFREAALRFRPKEKVRKITEGDSPTEEA